MLRKQAQTITSSQARNPWSKHIPEERDRLQSHLLVWLLAPVLSALVLQALTFTVVQGRPIRILFAEALVISALFGLTVWRLRAATAPAALCGGMICLLITFYSGSPRLGPLHSGLTPLMELFILTFAATRAGRRQKQRAGLAESRHGRRASQVLANLGAAGLLSSAAGALLVSTASHVTGRFLFIPFAIPVLLLAALTEATADTVSSEIGQAFGGEAILLTSLKRVPAGTDGAITLLGTAAGIFSSALVVVVALWALRMTSRLAGIAFVAGVAGLFFDSLLGATIERKRWLGNDLVNFASTLFSVLAALVLLLQLPS